MKVYIRFIVNNFLKSFLFVSLVILCLIFILNLLTEFEFLEKLRLNTIFQSTYLY